MKRTIIICAVVLVIFAGPLIQIVSAVTDYDAMLYEAVAGKRVDVATAKLALENGANPNAVHGPYRSTVFLELTTHILLLDKGRVSEAELVSVLQAMFKHGWQVRPQDRDQMWWPVAKGCLAFAEIMLQYGYDPNAVIKGRTLVDIAELYGQPKMVDLLIRYGAKP